MAIIARMTRSSLLEVLGLDYIRTARAKGVARAARRHRATRMRNALLPVVTIIGLSLGALLVGAVLTETIFNLTGVGRTIYEAITGPRLHRHPGLHPRHRHHLRRREPRRRHLVRVPRPAGPARLTGMAPLTADERPARQRRAGACPSAVAAETRGRASGATRCGTSSASARPRSASSCSPSSSSIAIFAPVIAPYDPNDAA